MEDPDPRFCLRWNNFSSTITSNLLSLKEGGSFVDVTLVAEGEQIHAHKLILSACSPYFQNILKNNPCQHPVIILREVGLEELHSILLFMYQGEVDISNSKLAKFVKLAEILQVKGLGEVHNGYLGSKCHEMDTTSDVSSSHQPSSRASPSTTLPLIKGDNAPKKSTANNMPLKVTKRSTNTASQNSELGFDDNYNDILDCKTENLLEVKLEPSDYPDNFEDSIEEEEELQVTKIQPHISSSTTDGKRMLVRIPHPKDFSRPKRGRPPISKSPTSNCNSSATAICDQNLPFPCPFCDKSYTSWGYRRRHIKCFHTSYLELPCKWCESISYSHQEWEDHVMTSHDISSSDAKNGLVILEEAHMVLQIAQPTRLSESIPDVLEKKGHENIEVDSEDHLGSKNVSGSK